MFMAIEICFAPAPQSKGSASNWVDSFGSLARGSPLGQFGHDLDNLFTKEPGATGGRMAETVGRHSQTLERCGRDTAESYNVLTRK